MAIAVTAGLGTPRLGTAVIRKMSHRGRAARASQRGWPRSAALPPGQVTALNAAALGARDTVSPPGVIGAAVVRAARHSAHLTRSRLARQLDVDVATVRSWEKGTVPLFCVPYDQLQQLADALKRSGAAVGREVCELLSASQCDLLLAGMLRGFEDYAEVPPIEEDGHAAESARSLLRWALAGKVPDRYRQHASPGQLLDKKHIDLIAAMARDLQAESHGDDLVDFGGALVALVCH